MYNLQTLNQQIEEIIKKEKQASRQPKIKMLNTLGGSGQYREMLVMLFDHWFCGDPEVRYETFKRMVEDNDREDL